MNRRTMKWMLAVVAIVLVATAATTGCKKKSTDPLPASGVVAGWQKTSETRTFAAADLWKYIDGDAEQYVSAGVVTTSTSDYKYQGQVEATVDVHTMGEAAGAHKGFAAGQSNELKSTQLGDEGYAGPQSVTFRKGTTLVRIVAFEATPDSPQALLALARAIESKL